MSGIEELLDCSDIDTVPESAVAPTKKSTEKPPHKSQLPPTICHRRENISSAVQPTKATASESLSSSLKRKLTPGKATDNFQEAKVQLGDASNS